MTFDLYDVYTFLAEVYFLLHIGVYFILYLYAVLI